MAKSARASVIKKNKSGLRDRVFRPVETARNDRLSAKLLELAAQPKPPRAEMEVEEETDSKGDDVTKEAASTTEDMDMDAATATTTTATGKPAKSKREVQRIRAERAARVAKRRKPQNVRVFASHAKKRKGAGVKKR